MDRASGAGRLLEIGAAASFVFTPSGRLLRQNDPDNSPAPLMHFSGCEAGNIARYRADVDDKLVEEIDAFVAREPPFNQLGALPRYLDKYRELLSIDSPIPDRAFGQIHRLPHGLKFEHDARFVLQGTAAGDKLFAVLQRHGLPRAMVEVGFADIAHFWEPWCVAMQGDEIASIAFAARLGANGADIGVTTMPAFRGRGFAAAVTACWTSMPQLKYRELFYSTTRDNLSSQRVIARLGLPFVGLNVRLG